MADLESKLRSIIERNQQQRADYDSWSARVVQLTLGGTEEQLEEFHGELGERFHEILQGSFEDPAASGVDGSRAHASDVSGESSQ